MSLSWKLALLAAVAWIVPLVMVFRHEVAAKWAARNDKWFRD